MRLAFVVETGAVNDQNSHQESTITLEKKETKEMKKLISTFVLLLCLSMSFAGTIGAKSVIANPKDPKSGDVIAQPCGCLACLLGSMIMDLVIAKG